MPEEPIKEIIDEKAHKGDLATPADFTTPAELYSELIDRIKMYHPSDDFSMIEKAYHFADNAHKGQKRKSGESYIIHPLCVAIILAELEMDKETIEAGLLHDVIEDTGVTKDEISREFSPEVAVLVDGVTKLTQLNLSHDKIEIQAENLRKMFLAMAKDIRVIIIKLADRLHNLRTLQYQTAAKQFEKAKETMEIYAPIAHRLGISKIQVEMDDLCMQYLYPDVYKELCDKINEKMSERGSFIDEMVAEVRKYVGEAGIKADINGRVKHIFSIYKKMKTQGKTLDQIYDVYALRIIVDTLKDCYAALGIIHAKYTPIPGRFKDYIAMPKANMYQSLHTTLIGSNGHPFEIQIRTYEMHRTAEYGIAAHWKYKESGSTKVTKEEEKLNWLHEILEWQNDTKDNHEFMKAVKTDLDMFTDQVYCFTPGGDVKELPSGSNTIDFAYAIHTAVGNKMVGARINGRQVPIETELNTGDRVEIITSQNSKGPSQDWLNQVRSTQAKTKINQWFKHELKDENVEKGKAAIEAYCKLKNINLSELLRPELVKKILKRYNFKDWDSIVAAIGHGGMKEGQVINRLIEEDSKEKASKISNEEILTELADKRQRVEIPQGGIKVHGLHDVAVRFSKCCSPVPGDEILGFVTRGRGISIHRTDCENVLAMDEADRARLIEAEWVTTDGDSKNQFMTEISIYAEDRTGLMYDVLAIFKEKNINLLTSGSRRDKNGDSTITLQFKVHSKEELHELTDKIQQIHGVIDIKRTQG